MALDRTHEESRVVSIETASIAPAPNYLIADYEFIRNLQRLRQLRSFFVQEAVPAAQDGSDALSLGELNLLRFGESGRVPTPEEWSRVEPKLARAHTCRTSCMRHDGCGVHGGRHGQGIAGTTGDRRGVARADAVHCRGPCPSATHAD